MDATGVSRIRERVERFLVEEHPERLSDLRDSMRRHPQLRSDGSGRRLTKMQAGIDGWAENLMPLLHLWRALRGAPAPLETLRNRCWETGFQSGIEVDGRHDFECVLGRWARQRAADESPYDRVPESGMLAEAVVRRLRASRFWKLTLGFLPIVGPIAAYWIDAALALRFHDRAKEYFRDLRAAGTCRTTLRSPRHRDRIETRRRIASPCRRDERCGATCRRIAPRSRCIRPAGRRDWETQFTGQG